MKDCILIQYRNIYTTTSSHTTVIVMSVMLLTCGSIKWYLDYVDLSVNHFNFKYQEEMNVNKFSESI